MAEKAGQPSNLVYYSLQEERRLSAEALARRPGAVEALSRQRASTDEAVERFRTLSDVSEDDAPAEVLRAVAEAREAIGKLPAQRELVDGGDDDQQQAVYTYYTDLIAVDLELFSALSRVDNGRITTLSQPLVDLFWAKEMISRSDALLARGWPDRRLSTADLAAFRETVSSQSFLASTQIVPRLPDDEKAMWDEIVGSPQWRTKTNVETTVLRPARANADGYVSLAADEKSWRAAMDALTPQLQKLLEHRTALVVEEGKGSVMGLLARMAVTTVVGLLAVVAVIWTTWRLTRTLRRRIRRLHEQAEALEKALPDVVDRLGQGERIDVETEARAIRQDVHDRASDELTRLGEAFNLARTSALEAAVRQANQHRGFERLLQRIARRTQQLIGQQMKKLDELERRHEDPELLDGLFDLDHLTARLRRYEENLVILAGGSPHRRWRKPVPLLDVMRSAQGEVSDYQRVMLDLDANHALAPRAVGPVSHVLAELIENALAFSPPTGPVEVRAAQVSRGLAIEVEDRGLGMDEERLTAANELMTRPPRMDLLAHTDDIRLGLHVVARLASQYELRVEFRTSAYGGTRAVVLVPPELVVTGTQPGAGPVAAADLRDAATLPTRMRRRRGAAAGRPTLALERTRTEGPSPYGTGGTSSYEAEAVNLYGAEATSPYGTGAASPEPHGHGHERPEELPHARSHGRADGLRPEDSPAHAASPAADEPPLPRRVRQASLVDELRGTPADSVPAPAADPTPTDAPRRAGATIGAFQRRSRAARANPAPEPSPASAPQPALPSQPTREDRS